MPTSLLEELIHAKDWSRTPLGPAESWPLSLRSALSICLGSRFPIVIYWGPALVVLYNDAYAEILGKKHPDALGRPCREVWSEIWDVIGPMLGGVLATGEATWSEDQLLTLERGGYPEECYFSFSFSAVRGENGGVEGIFTAVIENTRRVLGERRLRTLRDLGRIASEARSVADVHRQTITVLEASTDDVDFALLFDAEGRPVASTRATPEDNWPLGAEERVLEGDWPGGAQQTMVLPLLRPGGQAPEGYLVAGLSPRKRLDEPYRDFVRVVAANIAGAIAAARALEEQRERAAALAELDRAKTQFFSNVSHEFRTPLTLISGPLEEMLAAQDAPLPPVQRERAESAYRNSRRLLKLVNTLLDFSRIEAGRAHASYEAVDLGKFTAELASNFVTVCDKAGLRLNVECAPLPQPVHVDRDMWEKIVINLVSNAFKFTFEGGIDVRLAERDGVAELEVRDTGVGIAPHELPRVFERFHRVEGARSRSHEGSGIGLALVQELVRMHRGEIRVDSTPGGGSSFRVRLPFGTAHLPAERLGAREAGNAVAASTASRADVFVEEALSWIREVTPAAEESHASSARILVVDDNVDMRDYVARLLRPHWQVSTASDGVDALEQLDRQSFDLVLSDAMMPRMDGFALLKAIRSDPRIVDLPVVLLSARAGEESRVEGVVAGADDYLVKPFTAQQLVAQVSAQLTIARARRETTRERERLRAAEHAALSLFSSAPNPVVILRGRDHVIELANPAACEVWGRRHEEVIGRPLLQALPEVRGQGVAQLLDGVLASGQPYEGRELPVQLLRGTVYFNFVYAPMRTPDGSVEGVLVTAFDVTEQVRAREQLASLRNAAENANRTKDEFLAMLGHELRNPLSPIVSAMQLMRLRGAASTELDILERQVGHLTRLVDDLLDVSRITRGKIELRRQPMELAEAVVRALEMAADLLEQRGHRMDLAQVPRQGCRIEADPQRLAQVIANLLTNAAKYSEPGSRITLRGERFGDRVRLSVRDEGVGIAPDMIERVFELFVQQPQTLARSQGGLGLGLAIVRNIVELHGGRAAVKSAGVGMGSEFVVELPAAPSGELRTPSAAPALTRQGAERRVLIVDDNVDAAASLGRTLAHLGHQVQTAHDAPTALRVARGFRPEVALLDIGLPVMDGYELALRLREGQDEPLYLFAISGYGLDADRRRSAAAGFVHHFVKPVDTAELVRVIGDCR